MKTQIRTSILSLCLIWVSFFFGNVVFYSLWQLKDSNDFKNKPVIKSFQLYKAFLTYNIFVQNVKESLTKSLV